MRSDRSTRFPETSSSAESKAADGGPGDYEIVIQNPCRYAEVQARRRRPWLEAMLAELAPDADSFVLRFVSDREQRRLNREFRQKDSTTDVLSFPGDESEEGRHLGDVTVSVPTARRQAKAAGHSTEREVRILTLHGILHCLGYDHETDDGEMERFEQTLRQRWVDSDPVSASERAGELADA